MIDLKVMIQINGEEVLAGEITGKSNRDATFKYDNEYLENKYPSISISLPTEKQEFSVNETRNFFEGLLPEGFTKRSVAKNIKVDEDDYLSILSVLGKECIGAIRIVSEDEQIKSSYVEVTLDEMRSLAEEGATKSSKIVTEAHLSLTGATGKVGLYYNNGKWYLPKGLNPSTHIVKQSHVRLDDIVINERLCMMTAEKLGIDVPENFIIDTGRKTDDRILYATKRYDREIGEKDKRKMPIPNRLHQEDFAQALGIEYADKYELESGNHIEKIFSLISRNFINPIDAQKDLWRRIVFNYLIGNTDGHIKNISLVYSKDLKNMSLAPAYDIVSTDVYDGYTKMAFNIGGEKDITKIKRKSFEQAAKDAGIGINVAMGILDEMCSAFPKALRESAKELKEEGFDNAEKISRKILNKKRYTI